MEEGNFIMKINSKDEWPALGQAPRSYLRKFPSCEHLNVETIIEQMEKKIEKLNQDEDHIVQELKKKLLDRSELHSLWKSLRNRDECFKECVVWRREELHQLQVAQDTLFCMNKANKMGIILSGGELNTLSLYHKMLHKTKSMADEKQLLRDIKASQRGAVDPFLLIRNLKSQIMELESKKKLERRSEGRNQIYKEINKLESERRKIISTANLTIWDTLGSNEAIQNKIKDINIDLEKEKKENLRTKAEIRRVRKEMRTIDKHVIPLQKKLVEAYLKKEVYWKKRCKIQTPP